MNEIAKDILCRMLCLVLAAALLYMLPTLARLLGEFAAAVFVPLLEYSVQNMGNS